MSTIVKVIEVIAESENSFDEATRNGVAKASETIKNIKSAWVKEQKAVVKDGKVVSFRVNLKISFEVI